jgi:regulation of enolase protein 1 (concanavalin A-like superfamily)
MHRVAVLLLCALLADAAGVAAPASFTRSPWATGWDEPVDPLGDCRFERKGDKLTITIPAREGRMSAPRLLRDAEGDFAVQVHVCPGGHRAGLVLTAGNFVFCFERSDEWLLGGGPYQEADRYLRFPLVVVRNRGARMNRQIRLIRKGPSIGKAAHLQLEREGDTLWVGYREEGGMWNWPEQYHLSLQWRLKVGVVAEATAEATFKAVFDQFKLTSLGNPGAKR